MKAKWSRTEEHAGEAKLRGKQRAIEDRETDIVNTRFGNVLRKESRNISQREEIGVLYDLRYVVVNKTVTEGRKVGESSRYGKDRDPKPLSPEFPLRKRASRFGRIGGLGALVACDSGF